MLAVVPSATLHGLDGRPIRVEVDVAPGLPGFTVVGLGDTAVQEARERVRGAIRNAGFAFPPRRLTVNLAPAELRKTGASLDLAIAIGILLGSEQVRAGPLAVALLGELGLDGEVRPIPGILPMVAAIAGRHVPRVVVAPSAVEEGRLVEGIEVLGAASLAEAAELVRGRRPRRAPIAMPRVTITGTATGPADLGSRPPPSVPIATIPGLLPPLDDEAALSVSIVASAAGEGPITSLRRDPPFRSPHHTLSYAAM